MFSKIYLLNDREQPDAVFLQEVIPVTFALIKSLLPEYHAYAGLIKFMNSFTFINFF